MSREYDMHDEMLMLGGWQDSVMSWAEQLTVIEMHASTKSTNDYIL